MRVSLFRFTHVTLLLITLIFRLSSYGQYVIMLTTMFATLVKVRLRF